MDRTAIRAAVGRAFFCWQSRLGAASLIALAVGWCSEELALRDGAPNGHPPVDVAER